MSKWASSAIFSYLLYLLAASERGRGVPENVRVDEATGDSSQAAGVAACGFSSFPSPLISQKYTNPKKELGLT